MSARANDPIVQGRRDLAAALRWAARLGLHEGICNHFSLALPGREERFLINPLGVHWAEMKASDLVVVDAEGRVVEGTRPVEPTAFFIHSRIHRGQPRARCVLHTHMPYATALTLIDGGRLEFCGQTSLKFYGRVGYDEVYNGLALDDAEGDRICGALEGADILFMASHGVVVCGPTVAAAFDDLYYLERACMAQVLAQSTGRALRQIPEALARKTAAQMAIDDGQPARHLQALQRLLDRDEPGWSD